MSKKAMVGRRTAKSFVVAPAGAYTWVVAFSRKLIPGACFTTRSAAVGYASLLANVSGLGQSDIQVVDA
jgi:hypothetical protein